MGSSAEAKLGEIDIRLAFICTRTWGISIARLSFRMFILSGLGAGLSLTVIWLWLRTRNFPRFRALIESLGASFLMDFA